MSKRLSRGPAWDDPACEIISHQVVLFDSCGRTQRGPLNRVGAPGDTMEHEGVTYRWHLGKWMRQVPQTSFPADGRCRCGECGGLALIPIGTVVSVRGAKARVASWAVQDCWNVPCIDAEGGVVLSRDMLDGRPFCSVDEARVAAAHLAKLASSEVDADERSRLQRDSAAFTALAGRLCAGACGDAARLNPTILEPIGDAP